MTHPLFKCSLSLILIAAIACGGPEKKPDAGPDGSPPKAGTSSPDSDDPDAKAEDKKDGDKKDDADKDESKKDESKPEDATEKTDADPKGGDLPDSKSTAAASDDPDALVKENEERTNNKDQAEREKLAQKTTDVAPVDVLSKPLQWIDDKGSSTALEDRFAVLVAANKYRQKSWDIPFASRNLDLMAKQLNRFGGVPEKSIFKLSGDSVNKSAIYADILNAVQRAGKGKALLFFYFTGHGYVDSSGTPYYFTHFTREINGGYTDVVSQVDLAQWMAKARTIAKNKGCQLEVVTIFDACRTATLAPPPRAVLSGAQNWEIFSTQPGRFAQAPAENKASPFTLALGESLQTLSGLNKTASLTTVFDETKRRVKALTNGAQIPELRKGNKGVEPNLVLPNRINFGIRVVDAAQGTTLKNVSIQFGTSLARQEGETVKIQTTAGKHWLYVKAEGYLARREEVAVNLAQNSKTLLVSLPPNIVVVRGQLNPPSSVEAKVQNISLPIRSGYHFMRAISAENGAFELRIPGLVEGAELVLIQGTKEIKRIQLPKSSTYFGRDPQDIYQRISIVDYGQLTLSAQSKTTNSEVLKAEKELSQLRGRLLLPLPSTVARPKSASSPYSDAVNTATFNEALKWISKKNYDVARNRLNILARQGSNAVVNQWLTWLEIEQAVNQDNPDYTLGRLKTQPPSSSAAILGLKVVAASQLLKSAIAGAGKGDLAAVAQLVKIEALTPTGTGEYTTLIYNKARSIELGIAATLARRLAENQRWNDMFSLFNSLEKSRIAAQPTWIKIGQEVLPQALGGLLEIGRKIGETGGDWSLADTAINYYRAASARKWGLNQATLQNLVLKVERQRMPKETRDLFTQAKAAFAADSLEKAYELYLDARKTANTFYMGQIDSKIRYLQPQLYTTYLNQGGQYEAQREVIKAAEAYFKARKYDVRAKDLLKELVTVNSPQQYPGLVDILQRYQKEYGAEDSRLVMLKAKGTEAEWRQYLKDFPKGSARPQAWQAIRSLSARTAYFKARAKNTRAAWEEYMKVLWPQERPTVTVGPKGARFTTISEALDKAADGTRILVEPGVYKERVIVTRPLEIVGKGDPKKIIIAFGGAPALSIRSPYAVISGLTLRDLGNSENDRYTTIDINQGWSVLTGCIVESQSMAGLGVHNRGTQPRINQCYFLDCAQIGALFFKEAGGLVENTRFANSGTVGIAVRDASNPKVKKCQFVGGSGAIVVYSGGFGEFEDCVAAGTTRASIAILSKSKSVFRRCKVLKSEAGSVLAMGQSQGLFEDCEIVESALAGIEARQSSQLTFKKCTIRNGAGAGAFIYGQATASFTSCRFYENQGAGLEVRDKGRILLNSNLIIKNGGPGIWVYLEGQARVDNTDLRGNSGGSVKDDKSANIRGKGNKTG
ncbi:MAG: right-handed parallel beta-helix repeat-containing protein [Planctomycetota bacterium]|nr:right-handed parallel beta-helix repeat-containing protein [Planctomycetota bacterium]